MDTSRPLTDAEFKGIYSKVPRLVVDVLIETPDGFLLSKRNIEPYKGQWHIPGGTVRFGESPETAAERIAKGELGLDVKISQTLGYITYVSEQKERGFGWTIGIVLEASIEGGKPSGNDETMEVGFFQSPPANILPEQGEFLRNLQKL